MKEYEIYNPSGFSLPALKIKKRKSRKNIENDSTVDNLIKSKLLLNLEFNTLYLDILSISKEIIDYLKFDKKKISFQDILSKDSKKEGDIEQYKTLKFLIDFVKTNLSPNIENKQLKEFISEQIEKGNIIIKEKLIELSKNIQNKLSNFEEKVKIDMPILSTTTVYFCKKCNKIICLDKFKRSKCFCGADINNIAYVEQIPLNHFNKNMVNFLESNYWFEHGVDYILRKKNFQTLVGYDVLGNSSVWHEIDNITYYKDENYMFFCECKNSELNVKDVFIFSGKMIDIGGISGYIFTTTENVPKELNRLARSKNIKIIKDALKKNVESLIKEIKEGENGLSLK